jgi:hypothetical protein
MNLHYQKKKKKRRRRKENETKEFNFFFLYKTGVDEYRRQPCKFGPNRMGLVIPH